MIEIKGVKYEAAKMPPREQFHVMRRVSPLMASLGNVALLLIDEEKKGEADVMKELLRSVGPLSEALAQMNDDALDYVIDACLVYVNRLDPTDQKWHPAFIRQPKGVVAMYVDANDLSVQVKLVAEVLTENLKGFFAGLSGEGAS